MEEMAVSNERMALGFDRGITKMILGKTLSISTWWPRIGRYSALVVSAPHSVPPACTYLDHAAATGSPCCCFCKTLPVQDQASRDTRSAKEGKVDDPSAKPLKPILRAMPAE